MSEEEIVNLKVMVSNLDLSIDSKEKLYNQISKISFLLQQKENIIKEVREYLPKLRVSSSYELDDKIDNLEEILDKENSNG